MGLMFTLAQMRDQCAAARNTDMDGRSEQYRAAVIMSRTIEACAAALIEGISVAASVVAEACSRERV
jgi:hypothetical protein